MPNAPKVTIDKISLLRKSWLVGMPDEIVADAAACASLRMIDDGALVHARGVACDGFYTIARGSVRFTRTTADGHTTIIAVFESPNWFGEISIFDGLPRTHDSHAVGATVLLFHAKTDFKRLLRRYPVIYEQFAKMLSMRLRASFDLVEEVTTLPLTQRLARRLLELARIKHSAMNAGTASRRHEVSLTQEELGHLLGKSRQSIAKLLRIWEEEGLIQTDYGRVFIKQSQMLARIAYPDRTAAGTVQSDRHVMRKVLEENTLTCSLVSTKLRKKHESI